MWAAYPRSDRRAPLPSVRHPVLDVGLRRYGAEASAVDKARALAALAELAVATGDSERAEKVRAELRGISLSKAERANVAAELRAATDLADRRAETD
ncbi:hypothetical protein ACQPXH_15045 [Nocardia sp. CA-135953]|uniref:hypothetical protein n=1 Tax=Nocardia sp. CA-135953 TaxID=3239978 RepID=UPI003D989FAA